MVTEEKLYFEWEKEKEADGYIIHHYKEDKCVELVRIENINITSITISNIKPGIENHITVSLFKKKNGKKYIYRKDDYYCFAKGKISIAYKYPIPILKNGFRDGSTNFLSWEGTKSVKYLVMRKIRGGKWNKIGLTKDTNFIDNNIDKKQKYIYTVRCISDDEKQNLSGFSLKGIII